MSKALKIGLPILLVVVVAGGFGLWWFLRDDSPSEVSLDAAAGSVTTTTAAAGAPPPGSSTAPEGIEGTWVVDTDTGEFDYESATGTFVGFRVEEELASIGSATAVGRTGDVEGSMVIEGTTVTEASFEVDLTSITTNDSRRDDNVYRALETGQFPTARFTLTLPIDLGASAATGVPVEVAATGDLSVHGETRSVEFDLEAQLVGETIVVVGSTEISFADYGVAVPSAAVVLAVDDFGTLELQLLLVRG